MHINILEQYLQVCEDKWKENADRNNGLACQKWGSRKKTMKDAISVVKAVDEEESWKDYAGNE